MTAWQRKWVRRIGCVALVAPALLLVDADASTAQAAAKCMTKSQARAAHPRDYLKYRQRGGAQCWYSVRRGTPPRRAALASVGNPTITPPTAPALPLPPPRPVIEQPRIELVARPVPPSATMRHHLVVDMPAAWPDPAPQIYAMGESDPALWTVWPPLHQAPPARRAAETIALTGILALLLGLAWRRWNRDRIRISPW